MAPTDRPYCADPFTIKGATFHQQLLVADICRELDELEVVFEANKVTFEANKARVEALRAGIRARVANRQKIIRIFGAARDILRWMVSPSGDRERCDGGSGFRKQLADGPNKLQSEDKASDLSNQIYDFLFNPSPTQLAIAFTLLCICLAVLYRRRQHNQYQKEIKVGARSDDTLSEKARVAESGTES